MISAKCIRRWRHAIDDKSDIVRQEAGYDVHEREGGRTRISTVRARRSSIRGKVGASGVEKNVSKRRPLRNVVPQEWYLRPCRRAAQRRYRKWYAAVNIWPIDLIAVENFQCILHETISTGKEGLAQCCEIRCRPGARRMSWTARIPHNQFGRGSSGEPVRICLQRNIAGKVCIQGPGGL